MHTVLALAGGALHHLAGVSIGALALAVGLHVVKVGAEARSWHNIVRHAYPRGDVRFRTTLGAFFGSIGANAILPARIGEAVRLGIVRRRVPNSSVATITATILLENAVELIFGLAIMGAVLLAGRSLGPLGTPLSGLRLLAGSPIALGLLSAATAGLVTLAAVKRDRLGRFARCMADGAAILRMPTQFVHGVLVWKLVAWALRLAAVYCFLVAFHLRAGLWVVVLVVAAQNAASLVPISPGNAGTQQAAFAVVLAGTASTASVLGFGVGMQAATAIVDLVIGGIAVSLVASRADLGAILRPARWRVPALAQPS